MSNLTRFDPFAELARFDPFPEFDSMFRYPRRMWRNVPEVPEIKMDVTEDDKSYHVKAEIPGVKKDDITVSIDGNQVSVSAEMKKETEQKKGETVIRSERYFGTQYRGFTLPLAIDEAKAEAKYENGVLELMLPKKEGTAARQLPVH
ncbi:MAG: Hsp20/alpha crystallin family protein [Burkholderiales bacterium]